jgi:hypothetical protein
MWICANCAEQIEDHFDACWNCQTTRRGHRPAHEAAADDIADQRLKAIVNDRHKPMNCLRCSGALVHAGTRKFHEGPNLGVLGDWGEFLVDHQSLDMYICKACGHVEFFPFED